MANLWQIITESSQLPVQPGTNLWNHFNNLGVNSGISGILPVFYREITIEEVEPNEILVNANVNEITLTETLVNEIVIEEDQIYIGEF